jgi:hypothetical protein
MRKVGVRALLTLFCAGLAVSVAMADDPDGSTAPSASKSSWWPGSWFGGTTPSEEKKPAPKAEAPKHESPPVVKTMQVQMREQKDYLRRLAVCDRLAEIANEKNDQALLREVEKAQDRVFEAYMKRVTVPVGGAHFQAADGFTETPFTKKNANTYKPGTTLEDVP